MSSYSAIRTTLTIERLRRPVGDSTILSHAGIYLAADECELTQERAEQRNSLTTNNLVDRTRGQRGVTPMARLETTCTPANPMVDIGGGVMAQARVGRCREA